ncbi:MAG: DUF502 domain-containing protein [Candidatus Neomarinimicrobiota bacterium]|jgi:uncharacterized membrane protein|nr:DUF502 domain-containing protein [Candidatus Neomarinimicrobiota bacterium]MEC7902226.1 DUF502 domain-containing protein [Candidatus Neomarinimicrobiota bacterium]|tara:strand:- start:522 stop:1127 length:606 start_codon:yes stop_codon:yes gene_type:complete
MWQIIKRRIFAGLIALMPIMATYWIIKLLFEFLDRLAQPLLAVIGIQIPGLGIILTILFIFIIGLFVTNVLGRTILKWSEIIVARVPIVSTIYNSIKQITGAFSGSTAKSFQRVILIEYPRRNLWTMAFVTNESKNKKGDIFYHLFVPTTPNPTSGVFIIVPKKDAIHPNISVESGLRTIVSGGIIDDNISISENLTKSNE